MPYRKMDEVPVGSSEKIEEFLSNLGHASRDFPTGRLECNVGHETYRAIQREICATGYSMLGDLQPPRDDGFGGVLLGINVWVDATRAERMDFAPETRSP